MKNRSQYRWIWLLWVIALAWFTFNTVALSMASQAMLEVAHNFDAFKPLDLHYMGFTAADVERGFEALGPAAMAHYKHIEQVEDLWYPVSYTCLLSLTIVLLLKNSTRKRGVVLLLATIPFVALIADVYENHHIVQLIDAYPEIPQSAMKGAVAGNTVKWLSVTLSVGLVVILTLGKLLLKRTTKHAH